MKKLNLILHCGASVTTLDDVAEVVTPDATNSWHPLPHYALISETREHLQRTGLNVVQESHALTKDGDRYFGMMQVQNGHSAEDYSLIVGLRNSHDQSCAAGLALGAGVFVCDNLSFSGEVTLGRRHTRFISRDLPGVVARAVGQLTEHRTAQDTRFLTYKTREMDDSEVNDTIIQALDSRAICASKIPAVLSEWRRPSHEEFEARTAWSLFNAFTEVYKTHNTVSTTLQRSQKLHGLIDGVCGLVI